MILPAGHETHTVALMDASRNVPSGHDAHFAVPGSEALNPGLHVVHTLAPSNSPVLLPASHDSHEVLPSASLKVPDLHKAQTSLPGFGAEVPAGQIVHVVLQRERSCRR